MTGPGSFPQRWVYIRDNKYRDMKREAEAHRTPAGRIKLFEEFNAQEKPTVYLVFFQEGRGEGTVVAVATTRREAEEAEGEFKSRLVPDPAWDKWSGQGDVWIREVDPEDSDETVYAFSDAASSPNPKLLVRKMIEAGMDPLDEFKSPEGLLRFFDGDIDWMPEGPMKSKLVRLKRSKQAFGM